MSRTGRKKITSKVSLHRKRFKKPIAEKPLLAPRIDSTKEKYFEVCIIILLLVFGTYKSIIFFGAFPVPNPDYPGFVRVGQELLSFKLPGSFKRAPLLGILQVSLSRFMGGMNPVLTASWVLNDIFGTLNILLIWLVGKKVIGKPAIWLAFVAMLNPLIVRYELVPIAEIPIVFFALVTFFFIFRHSNWAYVFASFASMIRYEGAALIFIAFLMDMVTKKTKKERLLAFSYAAIASVPLGLWLLGTKLTWKQTSSGHYLGHYKGSIKSKVGWKFVDVIWRTTFMNLLQLPTAIKAVFIRPTTQAEAIAISSAIAALHQVIRLIAGIGCAAALVGGLIKRNWKLLALILYLVLFSSVHAFRRATHARYAVPIMWVTLLIACCGLQYCFRLINTKNWIPKFARVCLQILIIIIASVWLFRMLPYLPKTVPRCLRSVSLPYVTLAAVGLVIILRLCFFKLRFLSHDLALSALICVILVSQHFSMVRQIGNGGYNIEFKRLADWYVENAQPDEKLASTWASTLQLIAAKYEKNLVWLPSLRGKTFDDIVQNCYDKNITYVTWTSRGKKSSKRGVIPLSELTYPQDHGPFKLLKRIEITKKRWINVYRVRRPSEALPDGTWGTDCDDHLRLREKVW